MLQGDCLEVMKTLPDKSVDCFLCDLPYGCLSTEARSEESIKKYNRGIINGGGEGCPWDVKIDLVQFWVQVKRLCKNDNTPVLMFCNTKFGIDLINSNQSWFRYDLVWDKQQGVSFLLANKQPMKSHEMIYVFSKKGAYYKRIDVQTDKGSYVPWGGRGGPTGHVVQYNVEKPKTFEEQGLNGKRCPLSVINSPKSTRRGGHPTEKPEALLTFLLQRYCPSGGTVLDPTAGSFNTVFASHALGLHGIGIEIDKTFFLKAVERSASEEDDAVSTIQHIPDPM